LTNALIDTFEELFHSYVVVKTILLLLCGHFSRPHTVDNVSDTFMIHLILLTFLAFFNDFLDAPFWALPFMVRVTFLDHFKEDIVSFGFIIYGVSTGIEQYEGNDVLILGKPSSPIA
jgi:hypothetical protein